MLSASNQKKLKAVKELLFVEKDNFDYLERKTKDLEREIALSERFLVKMDKLNASMANNPENEDHMGMTMSPDGITEEFLDSQRVAHKNQLIELQRFYHVTEASLSQLKQKSEHQMEIININVVE